MMDDATRQQAVEILRMIHQNTQQGHVVSFIPDLNKSMVIAVDDLHNHATWRNLSEIDEDKSLEILIHGVYDKLAHNSGWSKE